MALIRRLDSNDDWRFGRGTSDYASNGDCVIQNLRTRLKEWKYNCFFNFGAGIDYKRRLGDKNQKQLLDEEIKFVVSNTSEIIAVGEINSTLDTTNRVYTATIEVVDIYGSMQNFNLEVGI